jgi:hypothetical protein
MSELTDYSAAFRQCLVELDVALGLKLWRHVFPHLPQPADDAEMLITLHMGRTASASVADRLRFYSHRWLLDQGYPSRLPDHLKPRAERMYPKVVTGVGISVNSKFPEVQRVVHGAMRDAVLEAYDDGRTEPEFVKARMMEERSRARKKLFG